MTDNIVQFPVRDTYCEEAEREKLVELVFSKQSIVIGISDAGVLELMTNLEDTAAIKGMLTTALDRLD